MSMKLKLISGGQTGVDRAALDFAVRNGIDYGGWCPRGGLAEDMPTPPGLLAHYPQLKETETTDYLERTRLNVKHSSASLIISPNRELATTGGTGYTIEYAERIGKPYRVVLLNEIESEQGFIVQNEIVRWIDGLQRYDDVPILNVAGPRASKSADVYTKTLGCIKQLMELTTLSREQKTGRWRA